MVARFCFLQGADIFSQSNYFVSSVVLLLRSYFERFLGKKKVGGGGGEQTRKCTKNHCVLWQCKHRIAPNNVHHDLFKPIIVSI